ncbi:MAG: ribonuclease III [bacterium]
MLLRLRKNPYRELEKSIGYAFRKRELLEMALVHRSYRFEVKGVERDNQRLEFLGDAVLGMVIAAQLYRAHGQVDEGGLTERRSRVTCGKALAETAARIGLGPFLQIGKGEEQAGGRQRQSLLADGLEAVMGAAYLDGGVRAVEKIAAKLFPGVMEGAAQEDWQDNPKGKLQELVQRRYGRGPEYRCVGEDGPPHQKTFSIEAVVNGKIAGCGTGPNRRTAEVKAATEAVRALLEEESVSPP